MVRKITFTAILFAVVSLTYAFDVSVYFDPVSSVRIAAEQTSGLGSCDCESWDYDCKLETWLDAVGNNTQALRWWDSMGVNLLCTT